jgi:TrmH family RNA methyltransferase
MVRMAESSYRKVETGAAVDAREDPTAPGNERLRPRALVAVEGFHAIKHAIRFGADVVEILTPDPAAVLALAADLAPDIYSVLKKNLQLVDQKRFQALAKQPVATGVLAIARRPEVGTEDVFLKADGPAILLEEPRHMGNLGAVIRVAAAAGAAGVLTSGSADPWHPAALRGSAGLHFALPVARIDTLPELDRPLIAIDPEGEPLRTDLLPADAILAFGSERHGLSQDMLERADHRLAIPMRPGVSSLNLATAVAVVLYAYGHAPRRLRPTQP